MSALTIYKSACRTYGILFMLMGGYLLFWGGLLVYISIFGVAGEPISTIQPLIGMDLDEFTRFKAFGIFALIAASVPIFIGIFAWEGSVTATVTGTVLYV